MTEPTITLRRHHAERVVAALELFEDWMLTCSDQATARLDHDHGPNTFALTYGQLVHHRVELLRALDRDPRG